MRVQHNIAAMNAYRNFSTNNSKLNKNLEKLSTGYKINRAGDDAAGLAISEKMRAQISGIEGATKNSKDGISLIQTAEGALTEVHDMLNRMTTLAEQSANGTYDDEVDRNQLQKEVEALKSEINRIADSTNYNGMKLLNGELDSTVDTKTIDSTEWSSIQEKLLAANATGGSPVVGDGTILHSSKDTEAAPASFGVQLNNFKPSFTLDAANGNYHDTVTIKVGVPTIDGSHNATLGNYVANAIQPASFNNGSLVTASADSGKANKDLTVTANEIRDAYEEGDDMAAATAKAIVKKYGKDGTIGNEDAQGIKFVNDYGKEIKFDVSLGEDGRSVKFTQSKPPVDDTEVINTRFKVEVNATNYSLSQTATQGAGNQAANAVMKNLTFTGERPAETTYDNDDGETITQLTDSVSKADYDSLFAQLTNSAGITFALTNDNTSTTTIGDNGKKIEVTAGSLPTGLKFQVQDKDGAWISADGGGKITASYAKTPGAGDDSAGTLDLQANVDGTDAATTPTTMLHARIADADGTSMIEFDIDVSAFPGDGTSANNPSTTNFKLTASGGSATSAADYNFEATVINESTVPQDAHLASTYIKASSLQSKIKDGAQMKIGDEVYTFAVGDKSTVDTSGKNVVDLTDITANSDGTIGSAGDQYKDIRTALQRLSDVAKDNEMFSVGVDEHKIDKTDVTGGNLNATADWTDQGGALSLVEKKTYSGSANLTTRQGLASQIQFSEGAKITVDESGIKGKALTLQIGDTSESFNKMSVDIKDMHADSIGIGDVDISTQEGASKALDSIKNAVNVVSDVRGSLGALQNRLDHTINNLGVMKENIQNAESLIRDTDVAEEMMTYTKNNILNQSAQAMLAQANQLPQGVLQLLG